MDSHTLFTCNEELRKN